jgi:hypothetical protein
LPAAGAQPAGRITLSRAGTLYRRPVGAFRGLGATWVASPRFLAWAAFAVCSAVASMWREAITGPKHAHKVDTDIVSIKAKHGNSRAYTLARVKGRRPRRVLRRASVSDSGMAHDHAVARIGEPLGEQGAGAVAKRGVGPLDNQPVAYRVSNRPAALVSDSLRLGDGEARVRDFPRQEARQPRRCWGFCWGTAGFPARRRVARRSRRGKCICRTERLNSAVDYTAHIVSLCFRVRGAPRTFAADRAIPKICREYAADRVEIIGQPWPAAPFTLEETTWAGRR